MHSSAIAFNFIILEILHLALKRKSISIMLQQGILCLEHDAVMHQSFAAAELCGRDYQTVPVNIVLDQKCFRVVCAFY